jgi:hypothetical protein
MTYIFIIVCWCKFSRACWMYLDEGYTWLEHNIGDIVKFNDMDYQIWLV